MSQNILYIAHLDKNETYTAKVYVYFAGDEKYERSTYTINIKCYDYGPTGAPTFFPGSTTPTLTPVVTPKHSYMGSKQIKAAQIEKINSMIVGVAEYKKTFI
ncbi:hypothetical protein [Pseudobacteroides cellulosolvens]|uniref:hypothetical protein n=1 Tax=Pseudobacteroides cellulosolvens TaxID=35825 RepID=UPI0013649470|nr:hypothetical protein [Pseudobacteroides cellulosolvens]